MAQTQKKQQDMGTGDVKKLLLQLMIPAVVAQVVNLLYNIVDRIYIGHIPGIGAAALTGVGLFTPILMLLNAFAMLIAPAARPAPPSPWARATRSRQKRSSATALPCCCSSRSS